MGKNRWIFRGIMVMLACEGVLHMFLQGPLKEKNSLSNENNYEIERNVHGFYGEKGAVGEFCGEENLAKRVCGERQGDRLAAMEQDEVNSYYVRPCGCPVGIFMEIEGVLVVDIGEFQGPEGTSLSPSKYLLQAGDYITAIDGIPLKDKESFIQRLKESRGEAMCLQIRRHEEEFDVKVAPKENQYGEYQLGIWIKDDLQGIGTLTYICGDEFGALGHGVNDLDTGVLVNFKEGELREATIKGIAKGQSGNPGSLLGNVNYSRGAILGKITENDQGGIRGILYPEGKEQIKEICDPMPVGKAEEIHLGPAVIRCNVNGEIKEYDVHIVEVGEPEMQSSKGLELVVVDKELLELTGGIVQGMSGSPIIQDGKIIGAVTHVFVNDPTRGYGIFIEEMLEN